MIINLWLFLTLAVICGVAFFIIVVVSEHKKKIKELELEALRSENDNLAALVEEAVSKRMADQLSRIEVLEAIVTDKNYDLNEKITQLK